MLILSIYRIVGIVAGCPLLSHVDVSGCQGVSNSAIHMMASKLRKVLTFLALADVSKELLSKSIIDLTENCSALKCLDISYNAAISELVRTILLSRQYIVPLLTNPSLIGRP